MRRKSGIRHGFPAWCTAYQEYTRPRPDWEEQSYMNSTQVNEIVNRLVSFLGDVKDGNMQKMNDYMAEEIRIYEELLTALTGK